MLKMKQKKFERYIIIKIYSIDNSYWKGVQSYETNLQYARN